MTSETPLERKRRLGREAMRRRYHKVIRPQKAAARQAKTEAWAHSVSFEDLEWIAGHFEGEGTVTISSTGRANSFKAVLSLASTDQDVIEIFNKRWPGSIWGPHRPTERANPVWTWRISGAARVLYFLTSIDRHLRTKRVRDKAKLVAEFCLRMMGEEYHRTDKTWRRDFAARIRRLNHRGTAPLIEHAKVILALPKE